MGLKKRRTGMQLTGRADIVRDLVGPDLCIDRFDCSGHLVELVRCCIRQLLVRDELETRLESSRFGHHRSPASGCRAESSGWSRELPQSHTRSYDQTANESELIVFFYLFSCSIKIHYKIVFDADLALHLCFLESVFDHVFLSAFLASAHAATPLPGKN